MVMFGALKNLGRLPGPYNTPPFAQAGAGGGMGAGMGMGRDLFAPTSPDASTPPPGPMEGPVAGAQPHGFFSEGGTGRTIAGVLGDTLLHLGGQRPVYMPAMQQRTRRQQELDDYARRRADDQAQWRMQQDYKTAHPDDDFTRYMQAAGVDPASPEGRAMYRQRAESMATPPTVAVDGFDPAGNPTKTFMPRTAFTPKPQTAGPEVGTVKNGYRFNGGNPNDRNSWVPVGGASPAGGATFR